jgi:hypothetical protein
VSPPQRALVDPVESFDEPAPGRVQLASQSDLDAEKARHDRRVHRRHHAEELRWIRRARLSGAHAVSIVDLSAGGVLLDSPIPLRPDSILTLQIDGRDFDQNIPFRVLRCQIGALLPERVYRGACQFTSKIELPNERPEGARVLTYPGAFVGLDLALKQLAERTVSTNTFGALDRQDVKQALESIRDQALKTPLDPIAQLLAALLDRVVPSLDQYRGLEDILKWIESQLRRTVPQVSLRLVQADEPARGSVKSVVINAPGAPTKSALVSVDLPRGVVLNAWQSRVLRVTSRLIALLQRIEPETTQFQSPGIAVSDPAGPVPVETVTGQPEESGETSGWQKIVVRYAEGQLLKGYTQDFSPARSQFSIWPSVTATAQERIIVPLARLKGVFFVRDFAGNPGYVERTDVDKAQHGRRIEVTLVDDEVVVGRTLSYRPDGYGFFVFPADPLANNIRIFIVSSAVRQVRFP